MSARSPVLPHLRAPGFPKPHDRPGGNNPCIEKATQVADRTQGPSKSSYSTGNEANTSIPVTSRRLHLTSLCGLAPGTSCQSHVYSMPMTDAKQLTVGALYHYNQQHAKGVGLSTMDSDTDFRAFSSRKHCERHDSWSGSSSGPDGVYRHERKTFGRLVEPNRAGTTPRLSAALLLAFARTPGATKRGATTPHGSARLRNGRAGLLVSP